MKNHQTPRVTRRRGAAAIEMGLTVPMLVLVLAAVIDWGAYMSMRTSVARAAMDGARRGAAVYEDSTVANPGDNIVPAAEARAQLILDEMGFGCSAPTCYIEGEYCDVGEVANNCGAPPLNAVLVTVTYQFTPFFGFMAAPTVITERSIFASESNN